MTLPFHTRFVRNARQKIIRQLSIRGRYQYTRSQNILIVAPHPDDETFGMGGFIADLATNSTAVHVAFLTSGGSSHRKCCKITDVDLANRREAAAVRTAAVLGIPASNQYFMRFDDGALPHSNQPYFAEAVRQLGNAISRIAPDAVFAPHPFEGWSDHIAAEELARAAVHKASNPAELFHYCVWFWHSMPLRQALGIDWRRAFVVEMSHKCYAKKHEASQIYLNDLAPCGNSTCGVLPSELLSAFEWTKELFFAAK